MNRRGWFSILAVLVIALLSGFILWKLIYESHSLGNLGLIGVFIASLLSHLTVVARDAFFPLFISLAKTYHPIILGAFAGIGGAIGEVTTYFLGWGVSESMDFSNTEDRIARWISKYGLWAVLLVAMTPLPDTPVVLLAGTRKLPFKRLLFVEILGKTTLYSFGAIIGGFVYIGLEDLMGHVLASLLVVFGSLVFSIIVTWRPSRDWIFGFIEKFFPQNGK
jgi:membrane protein YqaA with SNARE-associated domain